jgi:cytochrome bd-type quinol oxidase subunit 2
MRRTLRALNRLPIAAQFFLVPLPAGLAIIAYGAWRWTQADWGALATHKSHEYHVLGWMLVPLTVLASGSFAIAVRRGMQGRPARWLFMATALVVLTIFALIFSPWPDVRACACDSG